MKASRGTFLAALHPVLADVQRAHPGLLRLTVEPESDDEDQYTQAWLWEPDGSGTGMSLGGSHGEAADAVIELAQHVQEIVVDLLHAEWPACPAHPAPGGHALLLGTSQGRAVWRCPASGRVLSVVGELPAL